MKTAMLQALRKYFYLFSMMLFVNGVLYFFNKAFTIFLINYFKSGHASLLFLKPGFWLGPVSVCANFTFLILLQAAFAYVIPALVLSKAGLARAFAESLAVFWRLRIATLILVGVPLLLYIPVIVLNMNAGFLLENIFPDIIFCVAVLSIFASSLVIDPFITVATTSMYLMDKDSVKE
jgi:hypothetical protein